MTRPEDTEYEKLVQGIYQSLHDVEGIHTIKVEHNQQLEGKSGCRHQIDVYWEFKIVGEIHRVAIECKNYSKAISIGKVRDFFGVLHDIGNIKGIMTTKIGYQSGTKKFADYYGISLKEIRLPNKIDFQGKLKTLKIDIQSLLVDVKKCSIDYDSNWLLENDKVRESNELVSTNIEGQQNKIFIYDSLGKIITDFHEMIERLPREVKEKTDKEYTYNFEDGFIDTKEWGRIKIKKVWFNYDIRSIKDRVVLEGEEIAKAILKDVKTGDIQFFI
jgi:hypothetical protein